MRTRGLYNQVTFSLPYMFVKIATRCIKICFIVLCIIFAMNMSQHVIILLRVVWTLLSDNRFLENNMKHNTYHATGIRSVRHGIWSYRILNLKSCVYKALGLLDLFGEIFVWIIWYRLVAHSLSSRAESQLDRRWFNRSHIRPNGFLLFIRWVIWFPNGRLLVSIMLRVNW